VVEELRQEFRRAAEAILAEHPKLRHELAADGSRLAFPRQDESGFDVEIFVDDQGLVVQALGAHEHFEGGSASEAEVCGRALGLVRDLLSPDMRLRELRAGTKGVRWTVESRAAEGWRAEGTTRLLFFNYFGRRSERVYQNHQLPGRMSAG
jgi:hypothetical protein